MRSITCLIGTRRVLRRKMVPRPPVCMRGDAMASVGCVAGSGWVCAFGLVEAFVALVVLML